MNEEERTQRREAALDKLFHVMMGAVMVLIITLVSCLVLYCVAGTLRYLFTGSVAP